MQLWISTLALMAAAMMFTGYIDGKPTDMSNISPEVMEILAQQICASKSIPDCHIKTKDCFSLMSSMSGGGAPTCPGLSSTECLQKVMECSELVGGGGGGDGGEGGEGGAGGDGGDGGDWGTSGTEGHGGTHAGHATHGTSTSMVGMEASLSMRQKAEYACVMSDEPTCIDEVMECLMLEHQLMMMSGSSDMSSGPDPSMCEGVMIDNCAERLMVCTAKMQGFADNMGSSSSEEEEDEDMSEISAEQTAKIMCIAIEDPDCKEKVSTCHVLSKQISQALEESSSPDPSVCGSTDIAVCMSKLMECNAYMEDITKEMGSMQDENMSPIEIKDGGMREDKERGGERKPGNGRRKKEKRDREAGEHEGGRGGNGGRGGRGGKGSRGGKGGRGGRGEKGRRGEKGGRGGRGGKGGRGGRGGRGEKHSDDGDQERPRPPKNEDDSRPDDSMEVSDSTQIAGPVSERKRRNADESGEEMHEMHSDSERDPSRPLATLDVFILQVDQMMRQIDEMLAQFSVLMGVIDTAMDDNTQVLGMRPGMLSRREKEIHLSKYMCNIEDDTDCTFMAKECAPWLAPSPNLPIMEGLESSCSDIIPPLSSVADTCMDFNSDDCKNEAISCMNLLIATGGTSGYAGPLTRNSNQCEEMLMRMISSVSCSGLANTTECEMSIGVCLDTIRVKTDELHDHHYPEKLMCEPVMRPAVALFMCSNRDEADCFQRMHKCLINMAPEAGDMKAIDIKEMMACLKLTRPPVELICPPEKGEECIKGYNTCDSLLQPNAEFLKATQGCMGLPDEMAAKNCLQPAMEEMTNSIQDLSVQEGIKDLFHNFWTPSMGIVGIHSCMMMVCTMEINE